MQGLERLRRARGLTRRAVGEQLGVSVQTVYGWERLGKRPNYDHLTELAKLLRASLDEIVAESEQPNEEAADGPR